MTIKQWIKNKILNFLGLERLSESPNDERLTFISNDDQVKLSELKANKIWYVGNGDELLNYYMEKDVKGFYDNPIYNRNKRNYFWSLSARECDIKRVHSGIPNAIINTLTNVVGKPQIIEETGLFEKIAKENDFYSKLIQQARPLTLACGWGAWKINFNKELSNVPLWEFYDGEYVEYIYKCGIMVGMIFKSYYKKEDDDYVLLETRYKARGNSYIEYNLFKLENGDTILPVDFKEIEELADLPKEPLVIDGLNAILAVPSRYLYDIQNPKYGKSIYAGKIDLFDMLDEILSQASQTNRVSTPVEYYSPDVLRRGRNGFTGTPNLYNRQYVEKSDVPDGEGNLNNDIVTTQPDLNFDKYGMLAKDVLGYIFVGNISPASLGIDIAKKDNAEAQREKEKITIMTRNNIISGETKMLEDIVTLSLYMLEYMNTGNITIRDYDISIRFDEFANPSFENQIQILGTAWSNGQLSTEKYVELLWEDILSDEEKKKEIEKLEQNRQSDSDFLNNLGDENEERIRANVSGTGNVEKEDAQFEE